MTRRTLSQKQPSLKSTIAFFALLVLAAFISVTSLVTPALAAETRTMWTGVDFAWHGDLDPQAFKKAGVDFVVRYLSGGAGSGNKEITHHEADMWSKAGVGIVLVWETTASRAGQGYDAGYRDASLAFPQAESMGMPDGRPVYFAVDYDADPRAVEPYFKGIHDWARKNFADGKATSRIGVYGGHSVVKYIHESGYAKYKWQALAWMHGKGWQADAMQQHSIDDSVAGVSVDWNRVWEADYGVWFSTCVVNPPKKSASQDEDEEGPAPGKSDGATAKARPLAAMKLDGYPRSPQTPIEPIPSAGVVEEASVGTTEAGAEAPPAVTEGENPQAGQKATTFGHSLQRLMLGIGAAL